MFDAFDLRGESVEGFVPRNGMELSAPARTDAFQWLGQSVGVILAAQVRASAHTGAQLRRGDRIRAVVRFEPNDATVAHVCDQQTAAAAVMCRAADPDALFREGLHSPSVRSSSGTG